MPTTIEAKIDENGNVILQSPIHLPEKRRALVIILDEKPSFNISETTLLSESVLSQDWDRPEEDQAWKHLQQSR